MKYLLAIVALIAVSGCQLKSTTSVEPVGHTMCIAGFVETSNGKGTLDIYTPAEYSERVQTIPDVSTAIIPELELEPC